MHKYLVKKQRVKRIGSRKYGTAKYGIIVIAVKDAFVYPDSDASKAFINFNHPNALKKKRRINTHSPFR